MEEMERTWQFRKLLKPARKEREMLKRTAIRALCNTTSYQRGLDIYRTGKRIQSLDIKTEGAVDKVLQL